MLINIKVSPLSKKPCIKLVQAGDFYHIKAHLNAAPEKGKANQELIKLLSDFFKVPQNQFFIKKGLTSSSKIVSIPLEKEDLTPFITQKDITLL